MIIVTGATGFIGSNLLAELELRQYKGLVAVDSFGVEDKWRNISKRIFPYLVFPQDIDSFIESNVQKIKAIEKLEYKFPRLRKILADGGYQGTLGDWVARKFGWVVEVVLRPNECPSKFQVIPKRWIVERTFSWLENFRRLTIDYEFLAETAETMVQVACIQMMLNKYFR